MGQSGVKKDALGISGTAGAQATSAFNTANPIYTSFASGTQGLTPQQQSNMLTASAQSLGGGVSAATGQAGLMAARTGNAGGFSAALDDAAGQAGIQQSANALGVQNQSAQIARQNQDIGLQGLSNEYNTGTGASISALNAANGAQQPFWKQFIQQGLQSGTQLGAAALGG